MTPRIKVSGIVGLALYLFSGFATTVLADAPFAIKDGDRVVFYGDSITDQRLYTTFVETYILTRFPSINVSFVHSGWSGDTVIGGAGGPVDHRLERDVFAYKPTVVTVMLGMNDGRYSPFDQGTGVNLATFDTPMFRQAMAVGELTFAHNNLHNARWRNIQVPNERQGYPELARALEAIDALEADVVAEQRKKAKPLTHRFELIPKH